LRHFAPFNVDRAPTGQLVKKGTVDDPIASYPDLDTKIRKEKQRSGKGRAWESDEEEFGGSDDEEEGRKRSSRGRRSRSKRQAD
jgi:hypothetical protein